MPDVDPTSDGGWWTDPSDVADDEEIADYEIDYVPEEPEQQEPEQEPTEAVKPEIIEPEDGSPEEYDYEYTDEEYYEDDYYYDYYYEPPSKGDLGALVGAAFWQVTMPMLVFNAVQQKAYHDHFNKYEPEDYDFDMEEIKWKTKEMEVWDEIQGLNLLLWGPTLVLGGFALSGNLEGSAAWWIENMVSNFYIPVMLNEIYELLEHAYFEGEWKNWAQLGLFTLNSFVVFGIHMGAGTNAISYLRGINQTAEEDFLPSLFYKWGWMDHEDDDETYPY